VAGSSLRRRRDLRRLAKIDRHQLARGYRRRGSSVNIAERIELEQFGLRELLLGEGARSNCPTNQRRGCGADLQHFRGG